MADTIDEAAVIAWIDGECDAARAAEIAAAVAADPALTELASTHRAMKSRFAAAFGSIGNEVVALPQRAPAPVISLAEVRAERAKQAKVAAGTTKPWRWAVPGAIAASLIAGVLFLQPGLTPPPARGGIDDDSHALALSAPIAKALDGQLSGPVGAVRVALSFRDKQGQYCRAFAATHLSGIACRDNDGWQLRYGGAAAARGGEYRQAGDDAGQGDMVAAMIAGEPLDEAGERKARDAAWK